MWDSDARITALVWASSNCKQQNHPLVRDGAPQQQTRNSLTVIKIWSWAQIDAEHQDKLVD
jgi:hypothetical protein